MNWRFLCFATAFVFATFAVVSPLFFHPAQAQEAAETEYQGVYIRRPTLVVSNMDKALALYRDILGLKLGRLSEDSADSYVYTTFNIPSGTKVMHATMDTDKGARVLSLVEVPGIPPVSKDGAVRTSAILINANGHMDRIRSRLVEGNFTVLPGHTLGATGREFAFLDRDGHVIALYEFPPQ